MDRGHCEHGVQILVQNQFVELDVELVLVQRFPLNSILSVIMTIYQ